MKNGELEFITGLEDINGKPFFYVLNNGEPLTPKQIKAFKILGATLKLEPDLESIEIVSTENMKKIILPQCVKIVQKYIEEGHISELEELECTILPICWQNYPQGSSGTWDIPQIIREIVQNAHDAIGLVPIGQYGEGGLLSVSKTLGTDYPAFIFTGNTLIIPQIYHDVDFEQFCIIEYQLDFCVPGTIVLLFTDNWELTKATSLVLDQERDIEKHLYRKEGKFTIYKAKPGRAGIYQGSLRIQDLDSDLIIDFMPDYEGFQTNRNRAAATQLKKSLGCILINAYSSDIAKITLKEAFEGRDFAQAEATHLWGSSLYKNALEELWPAREGHKTVLFTSDENQHQASHNGHTVIRFPDNWTKLLGKVEGIHTDLEVVRLVPNRITRKVSWLNSKICEHDFSMARVNFKQAMRIIPYCFRLMQKFYPSGSIENLEDRKALRTILESKIQIILEEDGQKATTSSQQGNFAYISAYELDYGIDSALNCLMHELLHFIHPSDDSRFTEIMGTTWSQLMIEIYRSRR